MKKTYLLSLIFLLVFGVGGVSAVTVPYDCGVFVREKGTPVVQTVNDIPGISGTTGILRVINGADDDTIEKVSSSVILFNGVNVLSQEDFNQNVSELTVEVNLQETNTLSVEVRGKPGGTLRIELIQEIEADCAEIIGPEGGWVEVNDPVNEIFGTNIEIPKNVMAKDCILSIAQENDIVLPDDYTSASPSIKILSNEKLKGFVSINIPLTDGFSPQGRLFVRFYDENSNTWGIIPISNFDIEKNNVAFKTNHLTTFNVFDIRHDNLFLDLTLDVYLMFGRSWLFNHINQIDQAINMDFSVAEIEKSEWEFYINAIESGINISETYQSWGSVEKLLQVGGSLSIEYVDIMLDSYLPMIEETHGKEWVDPMQDVAFCVFQSFVGNSFKTPSVESVILSCGPTCANLITDSAINLWTVYLTEGNLQKRNNFLIAMDYLDFFYAFHPNNLSAKINEYLGLDEGSDINDQLEAIAEKYKDGLFLYDDWDKTVVLEHIVAVWNLVYEKKNLMDVDKDGWSNSNDNCTNAHNPDQLDSDGNGIGDACETNSEYELQEIDIAVDGNLADWNLVPSADQSPQYDVDTRDCPPYGDYCQLEGADFKTLKLAKYGNRLFFNFEVWGDKVDDTGLICYRLFFDNNNNGSIHDFTDIQLTVYYNGSEYSVYTDYMNDESTVIYANATAIAVGNSLEGSVDADLLGLNETFGLQSSIESNIPECPGDCDSFYSIETVTVGSWPYKTDDDGDSYSENQGDCNDNDPSIHPYAEEICGDGIDQDCDSEIDEGCTNDFVVNFPDPNLETIIRAQINNFYDDIMYSDLINIETLYANYNQIYNIEGIQYCTNLKRLDIGNNPINNIELLSELTHLTNLSLYMMDTNDFSFLTNLINLEYLDLSINNFNNLNFLANLTKLKDLRLSQCQLSEIGSLSNLTNLEYLTLNYNQLYDLTPLSNLISLQQLELMHNQIEDIEPLVGLINLWDLRLGYNKICFLPILSSLKNLRELYLNDNQIIDISQLAYLENLTGIYIGYNYIESINPLTNLTNLKDLVIWNNQIKDIQPLVNNVGIDSGDYVYLNNNPLSIESCSDYIPILESRGVQVVHNCVDINPQVNSESGQWGDTITQSGSGFTPTGQAELHFRHQSGAEEFANAQVESDGTFYNYYTIPEGKLTGTWYYWAIDIPSGISSPQVTYTISE